MKEGIIGKGDIASVLEPRLGFTYFASGVSNSREERESEYQREKDLLLKQDKDKHLVYFGSLSVFYTKGRYQDHKLEMEQLVKDNFKNYTIVRLGNITWGDNPHTIINFFRKQKAIGQAFEVQDTERYVCDKEEFLHWIKLIPNFSCEMNIPGERIKIVDLIKRYV
jgi:hypothetical protein